MDGSWCMIQAMRHIQMPEDAILVYLKKKMLAGDEMPESTLKGRFQLRVLSVVFFLEFKFKAPKVISTPPISSLNELKKDWELSRERMNRFILKYPEKWRTKAIYRHPAGMRIDILDTIKFLNVHLRHHTRQVHRIKKNLGCQPISK